MNKTFIIIGMFLAVTALCLSCGKKDPRAMGTESGKAQCACYQMESEEAVNACLNDLERKYQEYLNDTAYIEAAETQMLQCISDGVVDAEKPIKDIRDTTKAKQPTDTAAEATGSIDTVKKTDK